MTQSPIEFLTAILVAGLGVGMTGTPPVGRSLTTGISQAPEYEIVRTQDMSFGAARRFNLRVRLREHFAREQVERIARTIVGGFTARQPVNALSIMFYSPGVATAGAWDVAVVDWAPNGQWSDASTVRTGDYSSFRYATSYKPRPARIASSTGLRRSGQTGLHGAPLPAGAKLVERGRSDPRSGRRSWERYRIEASSADIAAYFNREMPNAGWLKDGLSTASGLFFSKAKAQLDILIASDGKHFTLSGS